MACTTCICFFFCCVAVCVSLFLNKKYFMESARASPVKLGTFTSYTFSVQISSLILRTIGKSIASIHSKQQSRHSKVSKTSISTLFADFLCVYFLILLVCLIIKGLVTACHHVLRILKKWLYYYVPCTKVNPTSGCVGWSRVKLCFTCCCLLWHPSRVILVAAGS